MLQIINDLPKDVVGIHATGEVTKKDYDTVLIPKIEELADKQGKLKYLLVLDTDVTKFSLKAWWTDFKLAVKHFTEWNKVAVVSDQKGVEWFADTFTHFIPGKSKGFTLHELDQAVSWIQTDSSKIK